MATRDELQRNILPIPDRPRTGLITYDAKDPDTKYPADRAVASAQGRAERPDHPDRRCGLRRVQRLRRPVPDAERGTAGGGRPEVQPLPHHRALLADAPGAADRTQPPLGRHGRHHRDRQRRARLQLGAARTPCSPLARDAQAQRLRHGAVRQVPRGAGVGDQSGRARSTPGRPAAAASNTSTASSAARRTSGIRRSTKAPRRSSRRRRPKRATTSWRT